jgi:hypothetical protein
MIRRYLKPVITAAAGALAAIGIARKSPKFTVDDLKLVVPAAAVGAVVGIVTARFLKV